MSDNAYNDFHDSLNATGVLSPEYKRTLSAILGKAMEQAAVKGREQAEREISALQTGMQVANETTGDLLTRRDELLRENADLKLRLEVVSDRRDELLREVAEQEREAIKLARSAGVVSTQLEACIRFANESGLGASEITPSRLRRLGALAFVLARRRERSAG